MAVILNISQFVFKGGVRVKFPGNLELLKHTNLSLLGFQNISENWDFHGGEDSGRGLPSCDAV
jgi:hypothetical protein